MREKWRFEGIEWFGARRFYSWRRVRDSYGNRVAGPRYVWQVERFRAAATEARHEV